MLFIIMMTITASVTGQQKLIDSVNEERMWELWLHKPTGKSWEDFKLAVIPQDVDEKELCNAVCEIENVLAGGG